MPRQLSSKAMTLLPDVLRRTGGLTCLLRAHITRGASFRTRKSPSLTRYAGCCARLYFVGVVWVCVNSFRLRNVVAPTGCDLIISDRGTSARVPLVRRLGSRSKVIWMHGCGWCIPITVKFRTANHISGESVEFLAQRPEKSPRTWKRHPLVSSSKNSHRSCGGPL